MKTLTARQCLTFTLCALALSAVALINVNQAPFWPDRSGTKTLWVDLCGNDNTAMKGRGDLPWRSVEAAATNASSGDTIWVAPGTYNVSNFFRMQTNGVLRGSGKAATYIYSYYSNANPHATIRLADNCSLQDLTMYMGYRALAGGNTFQVGWGNTDSDNDPPFTNAFFRAVAGFGQTDVHITSHSNICSAIFENCDFWSSWDFNVLKGAAHQWTFRYCNFNNLTNVSGTGSSRRIFVADTASTGQRVMVFHSSCNLSNAASNARIVSSSTGTGTSFEFHHCYLTNASAASVDFDLSTADSLLLDSTPVNPARVGLNLGAGTVAYESLVGSRLVLGGDADNGSGPTITRGTGVPATSEPNGSLFLRTDGGATTTLYVRSGGTWTAK